jgi:hypothetical protein
MTWYEHGMNIKRTYWDGFDKLQLDIFMLETVLERILAKNTNILFLQINYMSNISCIMNDLLFWCTGRILHGIIIH